jgi:O-antigen ligase
MIGLSVLTKSRMSLLALLLALLVVYICQWSRAGIVISIAYLMTFAAGVILFLGISDHALQSDIYSLAVLKRKDEVGSLTGRTPLWRELRPHIEGRPILGHGFAGFWTTTRHTEIAKEIGWPASHAHCAYIGVTLELGIIGAALWIAIALSATVIAARRFRRTLDPGYAFLLGIGAFVIMFSGTETLFFMVVGMSLLLTPGLVQLALPVSQEGRA